MADIKANLQDIASRCILHEGELYYRGGDSSILAHIIDTIERDDTSTKMMALEDLKDLVGNFAAEVSLNIDEAPDKAFKVMVTSRSTLGFETSFWNAVGDSGFLVRCFKAFTIEQALFNAITAIAMQYLRINAKHI